MSTPVTFAGNQYNVPAYQDTGYAQGTGNLSSYLIALAAAVPYSGTSDITITGAGKGLVVTTPDGTKTYRIYVDDNGELTTLQLT